MIFTRITLSNYGLFEGEQTLILKPSSPDHPVILVGGLNGSGKTSILEALQVCLYGKNSAIFEDGSIKYLDFLKSAIHTGRIFHKSAGVEVEFSIQINNSENLYCVSRRWNINDKGQAAETLDIAVNGKHDRLITDIWVDFIEQILPSKISPLFFFDGEQVEKYAKSGNASLVLQVGLNALLNLGLVDQVIQDVKVLKRQKNKAVKINNDKDKIVETRMEIEGLENIKQSLVQERASLTSKVCFIEKELSGIQIELDKNGGFLFEQKRGLEFSKKKNDDEIAEIESKLIDLSADDLPICLLKHLLSQSLEQAKIENACVAKDILIDNLAARDGNFLNFARTIVDSEIFDKLSCFLAKDIADRKSTKCLVKFMNIDDEHIDELRQLIETSMGFNQTLAQEYKTKIDDLSLYSMEIERKLETIPDEEAVSSIIQKRDVARQELVLLKSKINDASEKILNCEFHLKKHKSRLDKLVYEQASSDIDSLEARRIMEYTGIVCDKLSLFKEEIAARYIKKVEENILKCFLTLSRKESFLSDLSIDPKSLELNLRSTNGSPIYPEKLSAGERQLLVISVLWGLSKSSGRNIPVIIDTPLARLDSKHRGNLVENYFAKASEQVILLSTDEEINDHWHRVISKWVSREYLLTHNSSNQSTNVKETYFWSL